MSLYNDLGISPDADSATIKRAYRRAAGVSVFVKQLSSGGPRPIHDIEQFPEGLRYREFPR